MSNVCDYLYVYVDGWKGDQILKKLDRIAWKEIVKVSRHVLLRTLDKYLYKFFSIYCPPEGQKIDFSEF